MSELQNPAERRRAFTILFFSLMCNGVGQSVMFAILPTLVRRLHLSEFQGTLPFVVSATIWLFTARLLGQARATSWGASPSSCSGSSRSGSRSRPSPASPISAPTGSWRSPSPIR